MQWSIDHLFWVVFAGIALFIVFSIVRHGGVKAAMFGAKIERTIGEVEGERRVGVRTQLKVHALSPSSGERAIGIEFVAKSPLSYSMVPITLSAAEAQRLALLLQSAARR
jgi:hypothetical protein